MPSSYLCWGSGDKSRGYSSERGTPRLLLGTRLLQWTGYSIRHCLRCVKPAPVLLKNDARATAGNSATRIYSFMNMPCTELKTKNYKRISVWSQVRKMMHSGIDEKGPLPSLLSAMLLLFSILMTHRFTCWTRVNRWKSIVLLFSILMTQRFTCWTC